MKIKMVIMFVELLIFTSFPGFTQHAVAGSSSPILDSTSAAHTGGGPGTASAVATGGTGHQVRIDHPFQAENGTNQSSHHFTGEMKMNGALAPEDTAQAREDTRHRSNESSPEPNLWEKMMTVFKK